MIWFFNKLLKLFNKKTKPYVKKNKLYTIKNIKDFNEKVEVSKEKNTLTVTMICNVDIYKNKVIKENLENILNSYTEISYYLPKVFFWIDWKKLMEEYKIFNKWSIELSNFSKNNTKGDFTILMTASNGKVKISDGFNSVNGLAIGPYELNDNIIKFLEFSAKELKLQKN